MNPSWSERLVAPVAGLLTFLLLAGVGVAGYRLGAQGGPGALPDEFSVLADIYAQVRAEAVQVPSDDALAEGAAEGLIGALEDPYAAYYDERSFGRLTELLDGTFTGVGLLLEERPGPVLEVIRALPGGPAAAAGVEAGERIVSVDGQPVVGLPVEEVVARVRGPEGTSVTVGFDGGSAGPRELTLVREELSLPVLEAELLDDGTGHVSLLEFPQDAGERVRTAVTDLVGQGAKGIVLDLRGNPGGLLREAVSVASVFIDEGPIVSVREREGEVETFTAEGEAFAEVPLVVLVDEGTASASEIVAAAVQDTGRGRLVGETTFGKGTVQVVRQLANGAGVKFTTAEYLTPSGTSIEGKGVEPDVVAAGTAEEQLAAARRELAQLVAGAGR